MASTSQLQPAENDLHAASTCYVQLVVKSLPHTTLPLSWTCLALNHSEKPTRPIFKLIILVIQLAPALVAAIVALTQGVVVHLQHSADCPISSSGVHNPRLKRNKTDDPSQRHMGPSRSGSVASLLTPRSLLHDQDQPQVQKQTNLSRLQAQGGATTCTR